MRRPLVSRVVWAVFLFFLLSPSPVVFSDLLAQGLEERVRTHTLQNGMRILLVERHEVPTVSFNVTFTVGSVDEHTGITGIAHLYEHMAFKGTRTLGTRNFEKEQEILEEMNRLYLEIQEIRARRGRGALVDQEELARLEKRFMDLEKESEQFVITNEIGEIYQRHGGVGLNATTGSDLTRYMVSLPSNRLALWAALEADRMAHPVLREFYKEKNVVMEERRRSIDNSPFGRLYESFIAAAFSAHPYGIPVIGWMSDLDSLSAQQTERFFRTYYAPNNAVVAIVGDIHPPEVIEMLDRHFGSIPPQPLPRSVVTVEPEQIGERRVEVEFDASPFLLIGFHKPTVPHEDDEVFDVIDLLLSGGRTSFLYKSLVKEKKIAVSVGTNSGVPGSRYPNLFLITATPRSPHTTAEVEEAIYEELERLKSQPVEKRELQKILNQIDASLIRSLRSNSGLASQLAYYEAITGDWRNIIRSRERISRITPEDIMRVAQKYLVKRNRTVATLVKRAEAGHRP